MRRSELRRINRRRARRKNLRAMDKYCRYRFELWFLDGNRRRLHLTFRAGKYRHQPRRVREIVKGKRYIQTREEQSKTDEFVDTIVAATFGIALGLDYDETMSMVHKKIKELNSEEWAHRCRDCPECAVIFDSKGIYGHVPDRNSETCQSCGRYKKELDEAAEKTNKKSASTEDNA